MMDAEDTETSTACSPDGERGCGGLVFGGTFFLASGSAFRIAQISAPPLFDQTAFAPGQS
mgnify:CR=1 FL=1